MMNSMNVITDRLTMMIIENTKDLADAIRKLRNDRQLTLTDLAEATGVGRNTIYNIENCRNTGSIEILFKLLRSLGKSIRIE